MFHTKLRIQANTVQIKAPRGYLLIDSLLFFTFVSAAFFLVGDTREEKLFDFIIPYCSIWIICTIITDFLRYRSKFSIDDQGVTAFSPLTGTTTLSWKIVRDYGFAADQQATSAGQLYCFYFADTVLPERKRERKRFKGRYIRILIDERSYLLSGSSILDVCRQYTDVEPFTADPRKL